MNEELEAINKSRLLIEEQVNKEQVFISGESFTKYQKVYFSTNENIKEYLNLIDYNNKDSALTVTSSGDHIFNLINKGITNLDTFDTNSLTEYLVLGLKYAMIKKYSYQEYLNTYIKLIDKNISLNEISDILNDLTNYMGIKYKKYWKELISYNYKLQKNNNNNLNIIYMLYIGFSSLNLNIFNNNYLSNEVEYNKVKSMIDKINIKFKNINAVDLIALNNKKYDLILLSNILDYFNRIYQKNNKKFNINELNKYIDNINSLLKEEGILFLKYIFNYATNNYKRSLIFENNNIKDIELTKQEIYKIKSYNSDIYDGIILSKKY